MASQFDVEFCDSLYLVAQLGEECQRHPSKMANNLLLDEFLQVKSSSF